MGAPGDIDPYEVLGLNPNADDVVVHAAWKALLRKYHPDTSAEPDAAEQAARINAAFRLLAPREARAAYDRGRAQATARPDPPPAPAWRPPRPATPPWRPAPPPVRRRSGLRKAALIALALLAIGTPALYAADWAGILPLPAPLRSAIDGVADADAAITGLTADARRLVGLDSAPDLRYAPPRPAAGPVPPVDPTVIAAAVERFDGFSSGPAAVAEGRSCAAQTQNDPTWPELDRCAAIAMAGAASAKGLFDAPDPGAAWFELAAQQLPDRYAVVSSDRAAIARRIDSIREIVWSLMLKKFETRMNDPARIPAPRAE